MKARNEKWVSAKDINALAKEAMNELNRIDNKIVHKVSVIKQYMSFRNDDDLLSQGQELIDSLKKDIDRLKKIQI